MRRQPSKNSLLGGLVACVLALVCMGPVVAQAQQRLAYVLGNERYGALRLSGPSKDALAMSRALLGLGFDVIRRENTSAEALALGNRAAETVVLYFSGRTEIRDGQTYLMGAQLGDAPTQGWSVLETAQKFRAAGAKNVLVFVQNCYADADTAVVPADSVEMDGIVVSYAMSPQAECAATAEDELQYSERLLAALGTSGVDVMAAFQALPGQAMVRNSLLAPVTLSHAAITSDVTVTSDAVVISAPVATAIEITAVSPVTVIGTESSSGISAASVVRDVAITPVASSGGIGGVQIFTAAPSGAQQAALPIASGLPTPSIIVGIIKATPASFTPTETGGALAGTGLDGTGFAARQDIKSSDPDLYVQLVASGAFDPSGNLARAIQGELQRMKCYSGTLDGDFGRGSRRSLRAYFSEIKETPPTEQATIELFRKILLNDAITCPVQASVQTPKKPRATSSGTKPRSTAARKPKPAAKPAAKPKPKATGGLNAGNLGSGVLR